MPSFATILLIHAAVFLVFAMASGRQSAARRWRERNEYRDAARRVDERQQGARP